MSWNYRIIQKRFMSGENQYSIHEVYYDENDVIKSWSIDPIWPCGETKEELQSDMKLQQEAFSRPALREHNNRLIEVE